MRLWPWMIVVCGCGVTHVPSAPPAAAASAESPESLDELEWMRGSWYAEASRTTELWVATSETSWLGFNRTAEPDGSTGHHELMRLETTGAGVRYRAAPVGQAEARFALSSSRLAAQAGD